MEKPHVVKILEESINGDENNNELTIIFRRLMFIGGWSFNLETKRNKEDGALIFQRDSQCQSTNLGK